MNRWSRISMCSNIDLFDRYATHILAELYQAFPFRHDLDIVELLEKWGDAEAIQRDAFGQIEDATIRRRAELLEATIDWLGEAGYLTWRQHNTGYYAQAILTAKGLEVLKSTPDSLKKKKMLGDHLVEVVRTGAQEAIKTAFSIVVTQGITAFSMG